MLAKELIYLLQSCDPDLVVNDSSGNPVTGLEVNGFCNVPEAIWLFAEKKNPMSFKPVVNFKEYVGDTPIIDRNIVINGVSGHPNHRRNGHEVCTSLVKKIISPDEFETINTIYKRI